MGKGIIFFALSIVMIFSVAAQAQSAAMDILEIRRLSRARFDANGKLIDDKVKRDAFIAAQKALIDKFRSTGRTSRSIEVTNDAFIYKSRVVTVTIIEEKGLFVGLYIERNKYEGEEDKASLRFYDIPLLVRGVSLFKFNGISLIAFDSDVLTPANGGEVVVKYPINIRDDRLGEVRLKVLRSVRGYFSFYQVDRRPFRKIHLDVEIDISTIGAPKPDGGIKEVTFL